MARILVLYESKYGQTKKISEYIGSVMKNQNFKVEVINVARYPEDVSPEMYDGFVLGGPVHASRFPSKLVDWASEHSATLNKKPSAFFSVCLGILEQNPDVQREERDIVYRFFNKTGWFPRTWSIFAGALVYTKYNFFIKWVMKRISAKAGGATDTSLDHEYTDWNQVRKFSLGFCQTVTGSQPEMTEWQT